MKQFISLVAIGLFSLMANAQEVKQARNNDVASKYVLESDGDFFRYVNGNKCQITNDVQSFKVSQHPRDAAMVYFEKGNDLYVLNNASMTGNCPKAEKKVIMSSVKKYTVVSTTDTEIVNMALSNGGRLTAWENKSVVFSADNIESYKHNDCYGQSGKSFNTFVAFAIKYSGRVVKIRGGANGRAVEGVTDDSYYSDLADFTRSNNVCN